MDYSALASYSNLGDNGRQTEANQNTRKLTIEDVHIRRQIQTKN